ncbi:ATP-binding protein [Photobacterium sp.]|uniref:ATP-binding protein n=1 Tax=Photobacterium sp. TaxID=660 RepID=UPI00299E675E|nr:ATP-binding protein [Photobacterium sp.]MDX1303165.1 ATP-binding protein [Photobacterium sp.]
MTKAYITIICLLASLLGGIPAANAGGNYAFYPLPHQEQGSLVSALKIINNTNGGLWFVDVYGELIFYDGRILHSTVDGQGNIVKGVTDAVMVNQALWLIKDGEAFHYSPAETRLRNLNISQLPLKHVIRKDGEVWFANDQGLYLVTEDQAHPAFFSLPEGFIVTGLYLAGESLFVAGESGLYEFKEHQRIEPMRYPEQKVTAVYADKTNQLWVGTNEGLFLNHSEKPYVFKERKQLSHHYISSLSETDSGLWIGTKKGLNLLEFESHELHHFLARRHDVFSIDGDQIQALHRDEQGALWIASNNGVNYFPNITTLFKRLRYGMQPDLIQAGQINDVLELPDGDIWLATDLGLVELNAELDIVRQITTLGVVNHIAYRNNELWIATERGLKVFSLSSNKQVSYQLPPWFNNKHVVSIMVDHYESVWIGMRSTLYRYWPDSQELVSFGSHWQLDPKGDELATILFEDSAKQVWIGTDYALYRFDAGRLQVIEQTRGQGGVLDLYEDQMAQLWIVNNHSLQFSPDLKNLQPSIIELMGQRANPYCVVSGNKGVWLGSSKGVSYFSFNADLRQHFAPPAGVIENEFYSQACERLLSGKLLFGGREGLLEVTPDKLLKSETELSQVVIGEIQVNHQLRQFAGASEELLLVPFGDPVSFNLGVFPFSGQTKLQFRLSANEGDSWHSLNGYWLSFDSLRPGNYTLELRIDSLHSERQQVTAFPFQVLKPWYLSYWAMGTFILLLCAIIMLLLFWYSKNVKEQNLRLKQAVFRKTVRIERQKQQLYSSNKQLQHILSIRQNFMAHLSHELRTPLALILGPVKKMQEANQGEEAEKFSMIASNVERSLHLADQLLTRDALGFIEPEKLCEQLVSPILQATVLSWQMEADQKDIILCLENSTEGANIKIAPYHLEIMVGNLLSNALKYSAIRGCITVVAKNDRAYLTISVADTGKGMSEDIRDSIFTQYFKEESEFNVESGFGLGLSTVKQLVERYGGDISVISYQGVGSEFVLKLPLYRHDNTGDMTVANDGLYTDDLSQTKAGSNIMTELATPWGKEIMALVEQHFHDADFGTAAAAKAIFTSEDSLQRKFMQEFNMSFKDYVLQFRFEQAQVMLKQGDKISDVALACGFNDPSYFCVRFKNSFGMTPSQFVASAKECEKILE